MTKILQQTDFINAINEVLKAIQSESREPIDINFCNENHDTIFHELIRRHDTEQLKLLITKFPDLGTEYIEGMRNPKIGITTKNQAGITPLHLATELGYEMLVELLLKKGAKPNVQSNDSITPLHLAVRGDNLKITEMLLNNKAKPNIQTDDNSTALHIAVQNNNIEIVELLLSKDAKVNDKNSDGNTPLVIATELGHEKIVELLLDNGANINDKNQYGDKALIIATDLEHEKIVELLLRNGANIHDTSPDGNTAIALATDLENEKIVELLLRNGANIHDKNEYGDTPIIIATGSGNEKIVELLLRNGANVNDKNDRGDTLLHIAIGMHNVKIVELLLRNRANVNDKNDRGDTLLHIAIGMHNVKIVELLLNNGVNPNISNIYNRNALHTALALKAKTEIIELLLNKIHNINSQDAAGNTALNIALNNNDTEMVKLLISKGANVNYIGPDGYHPLHLAVKNNNIEIVKLLLDENIDPDIDIILDPYYIDWHREEWEPDTALTLAICNNNYEIVKLLIEKGADVNFEGQLSYTPLHYAVQQRNLEILQLLFSYNAKINDSIIYNDSLIDIAISSICDYEFRHSEDLSNLNTDHVHIIDLLIEKGIDIDKQEDTRNQTPLENVLNQGHIGMLKLFIERGANFQGNEKSIIKIAIQSNSIEILKLLISKGVSPALIYEYNDRFIDNRECNVLEYAIQYNYLELAEFLLNMGANTDLLNQHLHSSAQGGRLKMFKLLLSYGANIDVVDENNKTAIDIFIQNNNRQAVIDFLLHEVTNFDYDDPAPLNPSIIQIYLKSIDFLLHNQSLTQETMSISSPMNLLHFAVRIGSKEMVSSLIKRNFDLNAFNHEIKTPLDIALEFDKHEIAQVLIDNGARVTYSMNDNGPHIDQPYQLGMRQFAILSENVHKRSLSIHQLIEDGKLKAVKLLLENGANPNLPDIAGRYPLDIARENKDIDMEMALLEKNAKDTNSVQRTSSFRDREVSRRSTLQTSELEM